MTYTTQQIMTAVETWLVTGEVEADMFAENFLFTSPFWQQANKAEFLKAFRDSNVYQEATLAQIESFGPIIKTMRSDERFFAIVLRYNTCNGHSVDEAVHGEVQQGQLVRLLSIYDLAETKLALEL